MQQHRTLQACTATYKENTVVSTDNLMNWSEYLQLKVQLFHDEIYYFALPKMSLLRMSEANLTASTVSNRFDTSLKEASNANF